MASAVLLHPKERAAKRERAKELAGRAGFAGFLQQIAGPRFYRLRWATAGLPGCGPGLPVEDVSGREKFGPNACTKAVTLRFVAWELESAWT